jgi:AcrR family transcriptional regulator
VIRRRPRADAVRNRERVAIAARQAFAERGLDAQIEDVARRAGVGVGTVYRHFATKEALIDAALVLRFGDAVEIAQGALQMDDPWEAVLTAFHGAAELNAADRCFSGIIAQQLKVSSAVAPVMEQLLASWGELIVRAQRAGAMRADVGAQDVPALMCGLASVVAGAESPRAWRRYLAIVLDGLRAGQVTPLP